MLDCLIEADLISKILWAFRMDSQLKSMPFAGCRQQRITRPSYLGHLVLIIDAICRAQTRIFEEQDFLEEQVSDTLKNTESQYNPSRRNESSGDSSDTKKNDPSESTESSSHCSKTNTSHVSSNVTDTIDSVEKAFSLLLDENDEWTDLLVGRYAEIKTTERGFLGGPLEEHLLIPSTGTANKTNRLIVDEQDGEDGEDDFLEIAVSSASQDNSTEISLRLMERILSVIPSEACLLEQ